MSKRILMVASNYGVWNEELQAPWDILNEAGYDLSMATPLGKKPLPLTISVDPDFVDPIQNYKVNTEHACKRMKELIAGDVWNNPLSLKTVSMDSYDAIVMAGGLGADLDLVNNPHLHDLIFAAYTADKLICAICFAVGALLFTRDPGNSYKSIVYGKKITAHPREWDFKDDLSYELYNAQPDNKGTDAITPGFLLPLQDIAEDAVGPGGSVVSHPKISRENPSVVYDRPFITACSVESSIAFGKKIAEVLK